MICICIFISSVLVFYRDFVFWFFVVNSECDAYLPVDYSLVYGHSKMFLILSIESNLEFGLKPSFWIHISLSFCFLPLDLVSCITGILSSTFPSLQILFFHLLFTMNTNPCQRDVTTLGVRTFADIVFSPCYPWSYHSHKKRIVWKHGPNWPF